MFLYTLFYALIIALLLALVFAAFNNRGPWGNFWIFFIIIFLGMWLIGLWFQPAGPVWNGVAWLDLLIVGIILSLLLGAAAEKQNKDQEFPRTPEGEVDLVEAARQEPGAMILSGIMFWMFMALLIALVVIGIWRSGILL